MVLVQGAGKGVLKREGTACAKALGVCRSWQKASVLAVREWRGERLEMRLGRRHELDQILVFSLRAVGNLSRILSRNDMKNIFLLKRSLWLQYLGRGWGYVIASWGHPLGGYCSEPGETWRCLVQGVVVEMESSGECPRRFRRWNLQGVVIW